MKLRKEKGFTLIELMIVVAIIGILAAVAIPKFGNLISKAKEAKTKGNLGAIRSAITIYYGQYEGTAPTVLGSALVTTYMKELPAGEIPYVDTDGGGTSDTSYSWVADAAAVASTYASAGDGDNVGTGWAYDSSEPEVWVELDSDSTDTKGDAIYTW